MQLQSKDISMLPAPVLATAVGLLCLNSPGFGQQFIGGGDAPSYSTQSAVTILDHSGEAGSREIVHTIDGSGMLSKTTDDSVYTNMALFRFHSHDNPGTIVGSNWAKYGFDAAYPLANVWIWNWNELAPSTGNNTRFGWKYAALQHSVDGSSWSAPQYFTVPQSDGAAGSAVDIIVPVNALAKYVVLTNVGSGNDLTWGGDDGANDAGLSEVRFEVPEPAALGVLALGCLALLRRRS